jgi:hypothetical protein
MALKLKDKTRFNFDKREFELAEIIENLNISMWWTWSHELCPYCKEIIEKRKNHLFRKIEIYVPINTDYQHCIMKDMILLGHDEQNYTLQLSKEKIGEVLKKSTIFNYLLKESD